METCISTASATHGIDVRVAAEAAFPLTSAIPRSHVGYQVKAENMPRGKILEEMRTGGLLRASIQELGDLAGSYIIVSSKGSVSNTALRERKGATFVAMEEIARNTAFAGYEFIRALAEESNAANCVRVNDRVLVAAGNPRLTAELVEHGFNPLVLNISEFQKMDGGLSCLSLRF